MAPAKSKSVRKKRVPKYPDAFSNIEQSSMGTARKLTKKVKKLNRKEGEEISSNRSKRRVKPAKSGDKDNKQKKDVNAMFHPFSDSRPHSSTPAQKKNTKEVVDDSLKIPHATAPKAVSREPPSPPSSREKEKEKVGHMSKEKGAASNSKEKVEPFSKERVGAMSRERVEPMSREKMVPTNKERASSAAGTKKKTKTVDTTQSGTTTTGTVTSTTLGNSPPGVSVHEKWIGEQAATRWVDKVDFAKVKDEFGSLQKMTVDVQKNCKKWKTHMKLNQSEDYPALDSNLVKCPDAKDYVNMSLVEVPLRRNVYMGQIPRRGSEEAFWKTIFELRVTFMTILNENPVEFFPNNGNDFRHYGTMFVNNRRVENISDDILRFAIEVLPAGYSNSIICTITVVRNWSYESVHAKQAVVVKEILEMTNHMNAALPDETEAIISLHGAGRAGYFAALMIAIHRLEQKTEPNIVEIVKSLRSQRPKAVETITQYVSLYISLFYFIKRKTSTVSEFEKKDHVGIAKKCNQLTHTFTAALVAEMASNSTKSAITMVTP